MYPSDNSLFRRDQEVVLGGGFPGGLKIRVILIIRMGNE